MTFRRAALDGASYLPIKRELDDQTARAKRLQETDLERRTGDPETVKVGLARGGVLK